MVIDMKVWLDHFEYHAKRRAVVPEGRFQALSHAESRRIASSIATFQLAEQSQGRALLMSAHRREAEGNAAAVTRIIELLTAEKQHHAALIGAFLDRHRLSRERARWTDDVSRCVWRLAGLELHVSVLLNAELIGKVYYRALEVATDNRHLKALCRVVVADELAHVGFESDLLQAMRVRRDPWCRSMIEISHRTFLACASLVVWCRHRPVLHHAGYRMSTFMRACDAQYSFYLRSPKVPCATRARAR